MPPLPTGTVTFLVTDIEGSTRLVQHLGDARAEQIFTDHRRLLRDAVESAGGHIYQDQGESFLFVFQRAKDAALAAVAAQRAFAKHAWLQAGALRVRMGLHSGEPAATGDEYVGIDVHRAARISQAAHGGQILLSLTTRELVLEELPDGVSLGDLGEHRLKDLARPQRLFQVFAPDLPADFPPLKSLDVLPNNLPIHLTSFIGRERERAEVKRLLASSRLLTLTGAGGAGKTRLGLQVAAELLEEFRDGVWVVELASLSDPDLVPQAVASALGVREQPGRELAETLSDFLRPKSLLLILDNCEHVLVACARLSHTLLRACPGLRILATSRERLSIAGETAWRVPSLTAPDPRSLPPLDRLRGFEAVRLFAERAASVLPSFTVMRENAHAIANICQQLDGIPLALELAATRINVLSPEQIAERLGDRFRLLTGGSRTDLPRHQTLRAATEWSYDLLSEPERALLRRVSVFAGGFTLEAAAAFWGKGIDQLEVLDLLSHLVDKSLVLAEEARGALRYRLLETVRQFAQEKLEAAEAREARGRHRGFFLALAEQAETHLRGPEQVQWLNRLELEHDNLRTALEWSQFEPGSEEAALRLAGALGGFWEVRGYLREGRDRLAKALSRPRALEHLAARAHALTWAGRLALFQVDNAAARVLLEESIALCRELGDKPGLALALNNLGPVALNQGEFDAARTCYEESLAIRRELKDERGIAASLSNLGLVARCQGKYELARTILEECLVLNRDLGMKEGPAYTLTHLGVVEYCAGNFERAGALLKQSLALFGEMGNKRLVAEGLVALAGVAVAQGHPERAAQLFGAAQAIYDATGASVWAVNRPMYERDLAAARAHMNEEAFAAAWAQGQAMTLEQVIEYALKAETESRASS